MCPALDCIFGGGICRGLKHTTAAFVSQRKKNQDKNKNTHLLFVTIRVHA